MLLPMLLAQTPAPNLERQPTTMEVVGYQKVEHALPDGRPDPSAPDNFYVRTRTQWFLATDSDTLPVDSNGNRQIVVKELERDEFRRDDQLGELGGPIQGLFRELSYVAPSDRGRTVQNGHSKFHGLEFTWPAKQRYLLFYMRILVEQVEIRSEGFQSAIRTRRSVHWASQAQGWETGKPFVPQVQAGVSFSPLKDHVFETPTFGYDPVVLPPDNAEGV